MIDFKKADTQTLLLIRQWLEKILGEIGIQSDLNGLAYKKKKNVDNELWRRVVSVDRKLF